jgi:hypothetical protein
MVGGVILLLVGRHLAVPAAVAEVDRSAGSSRDAIALGGAAPG